MLAGSGDLSGPLGGDIMARMKTDAEIIKAALFRAAKEMEDAYGWGFHDDPMEDVCHKPEDMSIFLEAMTEHLLRVVRAERIKKTGEGEERVRCAWCGKSSVARTDRIQSGGGCKNG